MGMIARYTPWSLNLALAQATGIYASSYQTALPLTWIRDPLPTKRTRTKIGWTIITGFNDKLDFDRGGVLLATIAPGYYLTGAALATAVQAALTAADGATTWTVTYSPTTFKFTIAASASFIFKNATGANIATGIGKDMGYNASDVTSASQLAPNVSYQSRTYYLFDLGLAQSITLGAVIGHNAGVGGTFTLYGKTTNNPWLTPGTTQTLAGDDLANKRIVYFGAQSFRYWALVISDVSNPNGFSEIGVPYVGSYWSPTRGYEYAVTLQSKSKAILVSADQGALFYGQKQSPKEKGVAYRFLPRADMLLYQSMEDEHAHVLAAFDPVNYPSTETVYGVIPESAMITTHKTVPATFDLEFTVSEQKG